MSFDPHAVFQWIDSDPITPYRIEHNVDELFDEGVLEQKYNFIVYYFRSESSIIHARSYLDEINTVSIFGPFEEGSSEVKVDDCDLLDAVITYLCRRFDCIQVLSENGYETIWQSRPDNEG